MAIIAKDTFSTGSHTSSIDSRLPDLGGPWVKTQINSGGQIYLDNPASSGRARPTCATSGVAGGASHLLTGAAPTSANYSQSLDVIMLQPTGGLLGVLGPGIRMVGNDGMYAFYDVATSKVHIARINTYSVTLLGSGYAVAWVQSKVVTLKINATGPTTFELIVDGVVRETVTDPSAHTVIGGPGFAYTSTTDGWSFAGSPAAIDNVEAEEVSAPIVPTKIAITAQPASTATVGQPVTIVAAAQDASDTTDTGYASGTWRVRARSAPTGWDLSTVLDTDTPAAGVAAFSFAVPMAGDWTWGVDDDGDLLTDSPTSTTTTASLPGGGGGTTTILLTGGGDMQDLLKGGSAVRRRLRYRLLDSAGAPITSATGKPSISINGGAASTTPAASNAVHIATGWYDVELADASITAGDDVQVISHAGAAHVVGGFGRVVAVDVGSAGQEVAVDGSNRVVPAPVETGAAVWASSTRTLSSFGTLASDAATAVWATASKVVTSVTGAVGSVGGNIGGNVAGSVGSVTAGVTISGASITSVTNAVWNSSGRTLSSFGTLAADVAAAVWGAGSRTLSTWSGVAAAVWGELTSALTGAGSVGKRVVDYLDASISTRLAADAYTAPNNAGVASVQATTNQLATMFETDGPAYRFTAAALANSPASGGGGASDWNTAEKEQIRFALGLTGVTRATVGGVLDTLADTVTAGGVKVLASDVTAIAEAVGGHAVIQEILANSLPWPAIERHAASRYGTMTVKGQDGTVLGYRLVTYASTGASAPPLEFGPLLESAPTVPAS